MLRLVGTQKAYFRTREQIRSEAVAGQVRGAAIDRAVRLRADRQAIQARSGNVFDRNQDFATQARFQAEVQFLDDFMTAYLVDAPLTASTIIPGAVLVRSGALLAKSTLANATVGAGAGFIGNLIGQQFDSVPVTRIGDALVSSGYGAIAGGVISARRDVFNIGGNIFTDRAKLLTYQNARALAANATLGGAIRLRTY